MPHRTTRQLTEYHNPHRPERGLEITPQEVEAALRENGAATANNRINIEILKPGMKIPPRRQLLSYILNAYQKYENQQRERTLRW